MKTVAFVARSSDDLRVDVGAGRVVADRLRDLAGLLAEPALEAGEEILAVVVVLVEDGDLRGRLRPHDVPREHDPLGLVARDVADRPRVALEVAPPRRRAARDEELRDARLVEEVADRQVVRRPERVEHREDAVLLDELADRLDRPRRVVGVVEVLVLDLPPVHAAAVVHVLEVGVRASRDRGRRRGLAGERRGAADQDRVVAHARVGRGARERRRHEDESEQAERARHGGERTPYPPGRVSRCLPRAGFTPGGKSMRFKHLTVIAALGGAAVLALGLGVTSAQSDVVTNAQALLLVAGPEHADARPAGERHHLPRRQRRPGRGRRPDQAVRLPHLVGHRVEGRLHDRRHRREALLLARRSRPT